jgi:RNA-binding protein 39
LERQARAIKHKEELEAAAKERERERRKKEIEDLTRDQRTVFVSQLTTKVKEADLEDFFGQIGKVNAVNMIRDKYTNKHKGFAYVEMALLEDVPNCLVFNNVVPNFQKFPILVKASEAEKNFVAKKESSAPTPYEQGPDCRIYVGNIHVSVTELMLREVLEQYGEVESVVIHKDESGSSKGYAFARFSNFNYATRAMKELGGQSLMGRPLKVGYVNDGQQMQASAFAATGGNMNNSFSSAGNVSNWKLEDDDGSSFAQMNSSSRAMLMAKLGQSAGIAVPVPLNNASANIGLNSAMKATGAPTAVAAVKQQVVPPISGTPSQYFVISNMFNLEQEQSSGNPDWAREIEEDVKDESSKYGTITTCLVERRLSGGFVYMSFNSQDAACKAAASLHGRFFAGKLITVSFVDAGQFSSLVNN